MQISPIKNFAYYWETEYYFVMTPNLHSQKFK